MNTYLLRYQVDANRVVQSGYDVDVFGASQMKQVFSPGFTQVRSPPPLLNDVSPIVNHVPHFDARCTYICRGFLAAAAVGRKTSEVSMIH